MPIKPLHHLRPLLRLPSHSTAQASAPPLEHFTSNPSLLHHLPQNGGAGTSHAVANLAGQTGPAGNGGGAAGSGRAGWSGASGSGGYTGHARAFLSLPQTTSVDASSSLTPSNDDTQRRTNRRFQHHRSERDLDRHTRLIDLPEGSASSPNGQLQLREVLAARSGSRLITVDSETSGTVSIGSGNAPRRRSSIAFPSPQRLTPSSNTRYASPRGSPSISRSSSTADIALLSSPRPVVGVRALSTTTIIPTLSEIEDVPLVKAAPPPTSLRISNRVLMDLAGRDLPTLGIRRNHSLATSSSPSTVDDSVLATLSEQPQSNKSELSEDDKRDEAIQASLTGARQWRRREQLHQVIAHYRGPREVSPFSPTQVIGDPELARKLPLPSGYSVNTYNTILTSLITLRSPGESIAPILEIYNEMLERNIIPNSYTYNNLIVALCLREKDVYTAKVKWEEEDKWGLWRAKNLDSRWDEKLRSDKSRLIEGYIAEGNLSSALKLWRACAAIQPSGWHLPFTTYNYLLETISLDRNPSEATAIGNIKEMEELWNHIRSTRVPGWKSLYQHIFKIIGNSKDKDRLEFMYKNYLEVCQKGGIYGDDGKPSTWLLNPSLYTEGMTSAATHKIQEILLENRHSAMMAFTQVGEFTKAENMLEDMIDPPYYKPGEIGIPKVTSTSFGIVLSGYSLYGSIDQATTFFERYNNSKDLKETKYRRFPTGKLSHYIDALIIAGNGERAAELYHPTGGNSWSTDGALFIPDVHLRRRVYLGLLVAGRKATDADLHRILDTARDYVRLSNEFSRRSDPNLSMPALTSGSSGQIPEKDAIDKTLWPGDAKSLQVHSSLLHKVNRTAEIPGILDMFIPLPDRDSASWKSGYHLAKNDILPVVDLPLALEIARSFSRHHIYFDPRMNASILHKYGEARTGVSDPRDLDLSGDAWIQLLSLFHKSRNDPDFATGYYDDILLQIYRDFLSVHSRTSGMPALENVPYRGIVTVFQDRFGRDRTNELIKPFGKYAVQYSESQQADPLPLVNTPAVSQPTQKDSGETVETAPIFNLPSALDSSVDNATSGKKQIQLRIENDLSTLIDRHSGARPSLSPTHAYEAIMKALPRGNIPHPESLGRLINTLGRIGDEPKVYELYGLAQQFLSQIDYLNQQQQSNSNFSLEQYIPGFYITELPRWWRNVEDGMLIAMCHLGKLESAGLHRHRIISAGMVPSADAYGTMIASSKDTTDDALVARELFDESQAMGVVPHLFLYNTIISKLSKARKAETALELFAHMKARGVRPSSVTYGAVINACCRVGDAQSAETLFGEMSSQSNFRPRVPPYNTMMQFYLQTVPNREKVLEYYQLLRASGVPPSAHTYKLLLDAYAAIEPTNLTEMEAVFEDLVKARQVPVQGTHWASILLGHGLHGNNVERALEIFKAIPNHPTTSKPLAPLDSVIWEAILNVVAQKGSLEQLESLHSDLLQSGAQANAYIYNVLISGYARHNQIDKARGVFESMGDSIEGVAAPNNHPTLRTSAGHLKPNTITEVPIGVVFREPSTYEAMIRAEMIAGDGRVKAEEILGRMELRRYPSAVFMKARNLLDSVAPITPSNDLFDKNYQNQNTFAPLPTNTTTQMADTAPAVNTEENTTQEAVLNPFKPEEQPSPSSPVSTAAETVTTSEQGHSDNHSISSTAAEMEGEGNMEKKT